MKYYVYALIDPRKKTPYYIGKGKNGRHKAHFYESALKNCKNAHKVNTIKNIREEDYSPSEYTNVLFKGLSEKEALELETFVIDEIGLESLTNVIKTNESISGKENPFYGKNHSKETKARLSETKSGENHPFWNKQLSEEHRENIRQGMKGYERTKEHNKNIAEGLKGRTLEDGHKENIATLTKKDAGEIKWLSKNTDKTHREIAKNYPVCKGTVSDIKNEKSWKQVESKKV